MTGITFVFMKEKNFEQHGENVSVQREAAERAVRYVNDMWTIAGDVDRLPLSVDPTFLAGEEMLKEGGVTMARDLFSEAKKTEGVDRWRYIQSFVKLLNLMNREDKKAVYTALMTTPEAVKEIYDSASKALPVSEKVRERTGLVREVIRGMVSLLRK